MRLDIRNLLKNKSHVYLGSVDLYEDDILKTIDDVLDYIDERDKDLNNIEPSSSLIRMSYMEKTQSTPKVIKDIFLELNKYVKVEQVIGLLGLNNKNGMDWHKDDYHVLAINIIGNTTWYFEENGIIEVQKMKPGDLLLVPKGLGHKVSSEEERFSVSFIWK